MSTEGLQANLSATINVGLLVGETGYGKTSLLGTLADRVWRKHGKITRLYTTDGGGWPTDIQARIELGLIQPCRLPSRDPDGALGLPIGTMSKATQGHWPIEVDPRTGRMPVGVPMVPPYVDWWELCCPKVECQVPGTLWAPPAARAKSLPELDALGFVCPKCGQGVSKLNGTLHQVTEPTPGFEKIGCCVFDILTSGGEWAMVDLNQRAARNALGGPAGNLKPQASDDLVYGTAGMGGVGFAQNRVYEWLQNAAGIRGLVEAPWFTALESKGVDEVVGQQVVI